MWTVTLMKSILNSGHELTILRLKDPADAFPGHKTFERQRGPAYAAQKSLFDPYGPKYQRPTKARSIVQVDRKHPRKNGLL